MTSGISYKKWDQLEVSDDDDYKPEPPMSSTGPSQESHNQSRCSNPHCQFFHDRPEGKSARFIAKPKRPKLKEGLVQTQLLAIPNVSLDYIDLEGPLPGMIMPQRHLPTFYVGSPNQRMQYSQA